MDKIKINSDLKKIITTQSVMGRALGITRVRVNQLIKEGIIKKDDETEGVLVLESVVNYVKFKNSEEDSSEIDLLEEKAKHEKAKREMAELKLAKMNNSVYDARTVEMVMIEMLSNLRTQLLGLPSKLAPQLEGKTKEQIYECMTKEIEDKLSELSEYTPELFTEEEIDYEDSD